MTYRLVYRSQSLIADDERRPGLGEIFTTARRNNRSLGVTGALLLFGDTFVQALEGEEAVVRALYATISADPRHEHLTVVEEQTVADRTFARWAMAEVAAEGRPDVRLASNAGKGVIVAMPGVDASITPEQEAVLAAMRAAATSDPLPATPT